MPAQQVREHLNVGHDHEAVVRAPARTLERGRLHIDWLRGVGRPEDLDARCGHCLEVGKTSIQAPGIEQALTETRMEVTRQDFVSREAPETVSVREGEHRLEGTGSGVRADVEVDGHALLGAGPRAVERKVGHPARIFLAFGLADPKGKRRWAILPVPSVTEIAIDLPRPKARCGVAERPRSIRFLIPQ